MSMTPQNSPRSPRRTLTWAAYVQCPDYSMCERVANELLNDDMTATVTPHPSRHFPDSVMRSLAAAKKQVGRVRQCEARDRFPMPQPVMRPLRMLPVCHTSEPGHYDVIVEPAQHRGDHELVGALNRALAADTCH